MTCAIFVFLTCSGRSPVREEVRAVDSLLSFLSALEWQENNMLWEWVSLLRLVKTFQKLKSLAPLWMRRRELVE
jgi:hypothetical protein